MESKTISCIIQDLTLIKHLIEWDYPITYQIKIDEVIDILQEVKDNDEKI